MNEYRELFEMPENGIYLLNHSVGCLTTRSVFEMKDFFHSWANVDNKIWQGWINKIVELAKLYGKLFNGEPQQFCATANVTDGLFKILTSLPERKRKKIIYSEMDFPTVGYVIQQLTRLNYEPYMISADKIKKDVLAAYQSKIDKETQAVILPHANYGDNRLYPVKEINEICQKHQAYSIVDIAQTVGVIPFDLQEIPVDFFVGTSLKWLCGSTGTGFLYAAKKHMHDLKPLEAGWFSNMHFLENTFDIKQFDFVQDARMFIGGTPNIISRLIAKSALETLMQIGIDNIYQHNAKLKQIILNEFPHYLTHPANSPRGGTVTLNIPNGEKVADALNAQQIAVDYRPGYGLRVSPHIYNTEQEIEIFCNTLKGLTG